MLYYLLFSTLLGFIIHFYIIFGTNLLTGGPAQIAVFLPISVFRRKGISRRSPNGMKPSGELFLERKQSRRLGVDVREASRKPRGREARPTPWARPHPRGPLVAPPTYFFHLYILIYLKTYESTTKPHFHRRNLLYPWDPILGPVPELHRRGHPPRRASTSAP